MNRRRAVVTTQAVAVAKPEKFDAVVTAWASEELKARIRTTPLHRNAGRSPRPPRRAHGGGSSQPGAGQSL